MELAPKLINLFEFIKEMNLEKVHVYFMDAPDIPSLYKKCLLTPPINKLIDSCKGNIDNNS